MQPEKIIEILKEELKPLELEEEKEILQRTYNEYFQINLKKHIPIDKVQEVMFYQNYLKVIQNTDCGIIEKIAKIIDNIQLPRKSITGSIILNKIAESVLKSCRESNMTIQKALDIKRTTDIYFIKSIINFLNPNDKTIFYKFEQLERILANGKINSTDQAKIIISIIEINNQKFSMPDVDPSYYDIEKIRNHNFQRMNKDEINFIIEYNMLDLYVDPSSEMVPIKKQVELLKFMKENPYDFTSVQADFYMISGIMKKEEKTNEDYQELIALLGNLGINNSRKIVSKLRTRKKEERVVEQPLKPIKFKEVKKITIPQKQVRSINKEANIYFDFEQMQPIRVLTLNEIIYVLSLLKYIHADDKTIERFLILSQKELRKSDSITVLKQYYNKMFYHIDNEQVRYYLEKIQQTLEKYEISSSEDEMYPIVKDSMESYIKEIFKAIDNDFSFEEKCSRGLKRKIN